jgi:hypothetical protein
MFQLLKYRFNKTISTELKNGSETNNRNKEPEHFIFAVIIE